MKRKTRNPTKSLLPRDSDQSDEYGQLQLYPPGVKIPDQIKWNLVWLIP
jgi:hypothetical protein